MKTIQPARRVRGHRCSCRHWRLGSSFIPMRPSQLRVPVILTRNVRRCGSCHTCTPRQAVHSRSAADKAAQGQHQGPVTILVPSVQHVDDERHSFIQIPDSVHHIITETRGSGSNWRQIIPSNFESSGDLEVAGTARVQVVAGVATSKKRPATNLHSAYRSNYSNYNCIHWACRL